MRGSNISTNSSKRRSGFAANWFVAPAPAQGGIGSDGANGLSTATPFATLAKASTVVTAGQTVSVATGTYPTVPFTHTTAGTSGNPITFRSETTWGAKLTVPASNTRGTMIISGGSGAGGTVAAWVIWDGFELDLSTYTTGTKPEGGFFVSGSNSVVRNCKIHGINQTNTSPSSAAGGIQLDGYYGGSNMDCYGNFVYDIFGTGGAISNYQCIYYATNGNCYNNICGDTSSDCISSFHGANAMMVYNNTCYNGNTGVTICSGGLAGGSYPVTTGNRNGRIFNNIMRNCNYGIFEGGASADGSLGTNLFSNNNTFTCANANNITGTGSTIANNTTTDPSMVNYLATGLGDYHLNGGSPAKATGLATFNGQTAPTTDFDGVTRASPPSRGAYE